VNTAVLNGRYAVKCFKNGHKVNLSRTNLNNCEALTILHEIRFTFVGIIQLAQHEQTSPAVRRKRRYSHESNSALAVLAACPASQGQEKMLQKIQEREALWAMPEKVIRD